MEKVEMTTRNRVQIVKKDKQINQLTERLEKELEEEK